MIHVVSDAERKLLTIIFWMVLTFAALFALLSYVPGEVCRRWADQLTSGQDQPKR